MYCSSCGSPNEARAVFCHQCGRPVGAPQPAAAVPGWGSDPTAALPTSGAAQPPGDGPVLVFSSPPGPIQRVELGAGVEFIIGRARHNSVVLHHPSVSRAHARITYRNDRYMIEDLNSSNGTWLNGEAVTAPRPLRSGDVLRLGDVEARVQLPSMATAAAATGDYLMLADGQQLPLAGNDVYVGRAPMNDIVLNDLTVSRQHARLQCLPQGWLLTDLESSNGTRRNGQLVIGPALLDPGDEVMFGRLVLTFQQGRAGNRDGDDTLVARRQGGVVRVDREAWHAAKRLVRPRPGPPLISLHDVVKAYPTSAGPLTVLKGVSLSIQPGEFVAIVGPSGCGKSTLLNVITGIDRPDSGEVTICGQDILCLGTDALARWRGRTVGIVFQFFQLLPTLTVAENVMLPMAFCKTYPRRQRRARALEVLRLVGMDDVADRLPSALSGGQQQRVAIARALANDPSVLVADEPTGNLDSQTSQQIFELFTQLVANGKTLVMVTHDPMLARSVPRRIEMLDGGIVQAV